MIPIRRLSKLLGITSQMIRVYEREEVVKAERDESNYRFFRHDSIIKLIKCRRLASMGFGTRQIKRLTDGMSYQETQRLIKERADQLEEEIDFLVQKRNSLTTKFNMMRDIYRKNGTCELVMEEETFCMPVIRNDEILIDDAHEAILENWNKYAFHHIEALRIKPETLLGGVRQREISMDYFARAASVERAHLDTSLAYRRPEQLVLRAHAVIKGDLFRMDSSIFGFIVDYIRANNLRMLEDPMILLPFWVHENEGENYLVLEVPVEKDA